MLDRPKNLKSKIAAVVAVAALAAAGLVGLARPAAADTTFPQTGQTVWGPFEQYWKAHGGLPQFGMARTSVFPTKDGYDAQWFERAEFTYNPNNPDPYKVELQLLGNMITAGRQNEAPFKRAPAGMTMGGQYFEQTGHNLTGKFLEYWQSTGGLSVYGYPISEPFTEVSKSDGKPYTVQYFERNRFELHPELAGTKYEVQLGLLGSEMLDKLGGPAAFANLGKPNYYPPQTGGNVTPGTYPKMGHAPDYSWVAGQVQFTRIQGGCTYIRAGDESYSPNGLAWQNANPPNGSYIVAFGHLAGQNEPEPIEICPGGRPYIVQSVMMNP